jgi:UDP-N-acetylglucosamine--dolichyl-phosphate N-acetylglucosaminephosphotransferase
LFPKVPDRHKPGKPLVPNGVGVFYVLFSAIYLFLLHYIQSVNSTVNQSFPALDLAVCILFGGFMGLLDDWMDLRWRYKAFLPIFAALPLGVLRQGTPIMATYFWGKINFSEIMFWVIPGEMIFYLGVIPLIATVTTNAVNQLGGLNGLETICPSIVLIALMLVSSPDYRVLLYVPLAVYLILASFNFQGKIFVGNTGSFAIGITLASYAIIANIEQALLISILPYIFNSSLILINVLFLKRGAGLKMERNILKADHRRSLVTLIAHYYQTTERKLVLIISSIFVFTAAVAVLVATF